jgi:hypothetical protein
MQAVEKIEETLRRFFRDDGVLWIEEKTPDGLVAAYLQVRISNFRKQTATRAHGFEVVLDTGHCSGSVAKVALHQALVSGIIARAVFIESVIANQGWSKTEMQELLQFLKERENG